MDDAEMYNFVVMFCLSFTLFVFVCLCVRACVHMQIFMCVILSAYSCV